MIESKNSKDLKLEVLRGFCALMVAVHHAIIYSNHLNGEKYFFRDAVIPYSPSGHLMVLIFFILSGYVIGINYIGKKEFNIISYLKKRLIRIYPIYFISIFLTVILFNESYRDIIYSLFFGQNVFASVLKNNMALWSINHEMVYYLIAAFILFFNIKLRYVFFILFFVLFLSVVRFGFPRIIEGYLVGFIFWLTGFAISKMKLKYPEYFRLEVTIKDLIALFLLLLSCDFLNISSVLFSRIKFIHGLSYHFLDDMVNVNDFSLYFFCLYVILFIIGYSGKWIKLFTFFVFGLSLSHLFFLILNGSFLKVDFFYFPTFFLCLSIILFCLPKNNNMFNIREIWYYFGSISYAIYAVHMPILFAFSKISIFSNSTLSFVIRLIVFLLLVFIVSFLLEKKLQPFVRKVIYYK